MKKSFYLSGLLAFCFVLFSSVVKATPTSPMISTNPKNDTVCSGSQAKFTLQAADASGTLTISYSWLLSTDGGITWSLVATSGTYSGVATDTLKIVSANALNGYQYKGIATNTSGADTSTAATLTVDTLYSVINGASAVCIGSTITLSDATTGGTWMSVYTDSAIVNAGTGVVTGIGVGKDTILYISTNVCGTDTAKKAITVNSIPVAGTITGASNVCKSSSIALSDAVTGGTWGSLTPAIATVGGTGIVTGVSQGNATIDYTVSNGSCATSTTVSVMVDTTVTAQPITGPNATCVGSPILLMNTNVIGTGIWSASNTSATVSSTGTVVGVSDGTDIISYVFTNGCNSVTSTMSVGIDTILGHGVISGSTTVCAESWISLSETIGGGVWISGNPTIANVDAAGNVTGVSLGSAVISYYLSNACGASVATYSITVARAASVITGGDSVGIIAMLPLSDSATGGTWTSANTLIATINATSGVVTGVNLGTTTITYTVTNDCGTTSAMLTIYVGVTTSTGIIGVDSVCIGSSITLSDSTASGVWTASNVNASVSNAGVVMGLSSGLDTIYYTVNNGFGTSQQKHVIYVNERPVITLIGPGTVAIGGNYFFYGYPQGGTFSATTSPLGEIVSVTGGFYTYTSIKPDTVSYDSLTIPVTIASYVVIGDGTDVITYQLSNTCGPTTSTNTISLVPSGVNTISNQRTSLNVFPNPNQGEFTVNLSSGITEDAVITISNIVGEKVKELTISTNQPTSITLDQPAGMYFLSATTTTGKYSTKVTITK